ncbi:BMP family ABC transporter substrate-binding protein [uncultured Aeromicrobium sp.]|uniref:BMP family ABC transporter substrate-binding protein n=1 Tax=uncultured Aeromicrobium sp. TaxID=337820 RepID=UPI0025EAE038|nr:BMP family ABC transporter substrate-binding protein [uncultured Aeromicrobium sp.]
MGLKRCLAAVTALLTACVLVSCGAIEEGEHEVAIAGVFSGPTTDADYNALGAKALIDMESDEVKVAYSESIEVPDVERVIEEYVSDGYDIVWTHGSQFYAATTKVAARHPDVTFIGEFDGQPKDQPENVWVIDRNFHTVFYPLGILAAHLSQTGRVAYLGGLSLPFSYSEVHALEQAIADSGEDIQLSRVWTGDFNDTVRAQQAAAQLMSDGNDIIITSLNLGVVGAFQAVKQEDVGDAWITVKYTDKSANGPEHYAASVIYDFSEPLQKIVDQIQAGERSGYLALTFGEGTSVDVGDEVPAEAKAAVDDAVQRIESGELTVELDQSEVT